MPFAMREQAFPAFDRFEPAFFNGFMAMLFPIQSRERMAVKVSKKTDYGTCIFSMPVLGPLFPWQTNPRGVIFF